MAKKKTSKKSQPSKSNTTSGVLAKAAALPTATETKKRLEVQLKAAIKPYQATLASLKQQRSAVDREIERVEKAIASISGVASAPSANAKRGKKKTTKKKRASRKKRVRRSPAQLEKAAADLKTFASKNKGKSFAISEIVEAVPSASVPDVKASKALKHNGKRGRAAQYTCR